MLLPSKMEPRNMTAWKLVSSLICFIGGFILPVRGDEIQHPALEDAPRITRTMTGIHGDPICVGLIGTKEEIIAAMLTAKWQPADAITFKSSVKLACSIVLHHPDETAPVSNLYLWKRKEDLAFEQEVGKDAAAVTTFGSGCPQSRWMVARCGSGQQRSTRRSDSATRRE